MWEQIMLTGFQVDWNTQEGELDAWDYAFLGCGQKMNEIKWNSDIGPNWMISQSIIWHKGKAYLLGQYMNLKTSKCLK